MRVGFATNDPSLFIAFIAAAIVLGLIFAVIYNAQSTDVKNSDYDNDVKKIIEKAKMLAIDAALRYEIDSEEIAKITTEQYSAEIQDLIVSNFDDRPERTNLYIATLDHLSAQANHAALEARVLKARQRTT